MTCATCNAAICDCFDSAWVHPVQPPHDSAPPAQSFEPRPGLPPLTGAGSLGEDEIRVIRDRHYGWESASPALLAKVFGVSHQRISAILRAHPGVSQERSR